MVRNYQPNGAAITFSNVSVELGGNNILDNVSAHVPRGSCTAIVGPNGAGKSTLLNALLGETPYKGRIEVSRLDERTPLRIGYMPQRVQFDRGMPFTVLEFMTMGWQRSPFWFGVRDQHRARAVDLLQSVGMSGMEKRNVGALSGGELQRLLLALALSQEPDLLVLDEPASGVDFQGEHIFCELLERLRSERGFTQLMVSHDLPSVTHHATHVICLNRKLAAEGTPSEVLTPETLTAIFGIHMGLVDNRMLPGCLCSAPLPCHVKETGDA